MPRIKGQGRKTGRKDSKGRDIFEWGRSEPQKASNTESTALDSSGDINSKVPVSDASITIYTKVGEIDFSGTSNDNPFEEWGNQAHDEPECFRAFLNEDGELVIEQEYSEDPVQQLTFVLKDDIMGDDDSLGELYPTIVNDDKILSIYDEEVKKYLEKNNGENNPDDSSISDVKVTYDNDSPDIDFQRWTGSVTLDTEKHKDVEFDDIYGKFNRIHNFIVGKFPDELYDSIRERVSGETCYEDRLEAVKGLIDNGNVDELDYCDEMDKIDEIIYRAKSQGVDIRQYSGQTKPEESE